MLRSRRRASSSPASNRPASQSASLAAAQAFLRDRESNGALSSAAAAAALRTHTRTPTPVGETVTKRMVRKGSVSSQGSGSHARPGLHRTSSSGSMTERSFRAASPSRSSPVDPNAPPVPAVPKNVPQVSVVHRRNSSLEPPARGGSPIGRGGGRGVSLDRGTSNAGQYGRGQARATPLSKVVEDERDAGQRASINFSRPMSPPQAPSPTPRPATSARGGHGGWFTGPVVDPEQTFRGEKPRPKTSGGISTQATQQAVRNAADRPVSTRAAHMANGVEGSRLATGSMRAKPSGTAVQQAPQMYTAGIDRPVRVVDPNSPFAVYDPSSRKFIHKQDAMNLHRALSDAEEPAPPYEPQQAVQQQIPRYSQPQNRNVVQRSASVSPQPVAYTRQSLAAAPTPTTGATYAIPHDEPASYTAQEFAEAEDRLPAVIDTSRKLEPSAPEPLHEQETASPKLAHNQDSSYPRLTPTPTLTPSGPSSQGGERSPRTHSLSPPRNAHFAPVAVEFPNGVKHQPPGRSVSPAKSALKASPSVSGRSPSPLANEGRAVNREAPSEVSDVGSEDGGKKKKKVRISFDEEPTVLGTSAYANSEAMSPPAGPLASKWETLNEEEDLDEFMKPRPALPSFGSIRDKNRRPRDGDIPEKVTETVSSSMSNSATLMGDSTEVSSDHKIGGILANDFVSKKASHSPHDPLPPEVTSVEGSGYYSDSDSSEASDTAPVSPAETIENVRKRVESMRSRPEPEPKTLTHPSEPRAPLEVPAISVQPASPPLPQNVVNQSAPVVDSAPATQPAPKEPRPFIPGGWGDDDASEPETEVKQSTSPASAPSQPSITIQIPERPVDDDSSDDNSSVYSDAYEDIEDAEGFGSIDAIMESPILVPSSRFASESSSPSDARAHQTGLESSKWAPVNAEDIQETASPKRRTGLESSKWAPTNAEDIKADVIQEQRKAQTNADWGKSQQYWSELNDARKAKPPSRLLINQLGSDEKPKRSPQVSTPVKQVREGPNEDALVPIPPKSQERRVKVAPAAAQMQAPPTQPAKAPTQPRKSALKKTTLSPQAEIPLKKTMRERAPVSNAAEPQMRKTMRGADGGGFTSRGSPVAAAQRQNMPAVDTKAPRGALQKRHLPAVAAGAAAQPRPQSTSGLPSKTKPSVPPAPTYDSDSDASVSSFQRERQRNRASRNNSGRYTMRASMRAGPTPTMRAAPPVRSISPPRSPASPPPSTLRKSMRPSSPTPEAEGARSSRFSIRSLSPAGRFRRRSTAEAPPSVPLAPPPTKNKKSVFGKQAKPLKSRGNDSSDEEEDRPRRFQSRFADSDSEEEFELPPGLAPVRGIPKRPGEEDGDSTDLEDEASDDEPPTTNGNGNGKGKSAVTNGSANQGSSLSAGSLRKQELPTFGTGKKAKRGFFGFGKKKHGAYLTDGDVETQAPTNFDIPMPPAQQNRDRNRALTPIGEDGDIGAGEAVTATNPPPKSGRRTPLERSASDSWPLASPNPPFAQDQRPQSADGPGSRRPTLMKRNPSQISHARTDVDPKSGKEISFGRSGKKKKFQGLRRVLGLND